MRDLLRIRDLRVSFTLPEGRLELMTGIRERRFFDPGTRPGQISAITAATISQRCCSEKRMRRSSGRMSVDVPFRRGATGDERGAPDRVAAARDEPLAGNEMIDQQHVALPRENADLLADETLAGELEVDDRDAAVVDDRGRRNDDAGRLHRGQQVSFDRRAEGESGGGRNLDEHGDRSRLARDLRRPHQVAMTEATVESVEVEEVDGELIAWVREAYDAAG